MKAALVVAFLGALLAVSTACPTVPYHACVQEEKPTKCTAIEVCEDDYKEPCGDSYCEYPYTCATLQREECVNFAALQAKCDPKRVCKEIKKPCGTGACGYNQDCVKETVCTVRSAGRKLLDDTKAVANSLAVAEGDDATAKADSAAYAEDGGYAEANSVAVATSDEDDDDDDEDLYVVVPHYGCDSGCDDPDQLVCEDKYTCVARDPCEEVVVKKCVKSELREGIDVCHGGYYFTWVGILAGEKCGDEYCGYGYECADVVIQTCTTPCGDSECGYGYECVADEEDPECAHYAWLATVCRDVYEPVCVALSPYCLLNYHPPCKTVYKCEVEDAICGGDYCPYGYHCAVDYKKTCDGAAYDPGYGPVVSKPVDCPDPVYTYVINPVYAPEDDDDDDSASAIATSTSVADGDTAATYTSTETTGDAKADAGAYAETDDASALSLSSSAEGFAKTFTEAFAEDDGEAYADADAKSDSD